METWNTKNIKKTQIEHLEIKTTTSEMKNMLDGVNGRLDVAEDY